MENDCKGLKYDKAEKTIAFLSLKVIQTKVIKLFIEYELAIFIKGLAVSQDL